MAEGVAPAVPEPEKPYFSAEQMARFAEFLTGEPARDQEGFRALLATVTEVLGETDSDTLLRTLVDRAIHTSRAERGMILLHEGGELKVRVARDRKGRDLGPEPSMSRGVPDSVFRDGKPILVRVGRDGEYLDLTRSVAAMRLRHVMCAPLRARGRTIGVLYVDSTAGGPAHTPSDLMLFHTQAGLTAMAIEHRRLLDETMQARVVGDQLRVARDIQRRLLPEAPASYSGIEMAGVSEPYERVGGDYFDYFPIDMERVGLAIADVSGHGIGPALIMSNVRAHLRSLLETRRSLGGLYGLMNRALCHDLAHGMFVSLFVAVFDRSRKLLEFQNAGQCAPLLYTPSKERFVSIHANAPALGILHDVSAGPCPAIPVKEGDYLVCYTDGVTEMPAPSGEMFGEERMREVVRSAANEGASPAGVIGAVRVALGQHAAGIPARDDITLLVARF
ncbi:MAG: PP2C family protein-serine/threonine phosphatase [Planctomycetota bacterium]